jgi:hypothetical protein
VQYAEFQVIFDENNSICMLCRIKDDISFPGYIFKMKNKDKLLVCTKSVGIVLGSREMFQGLQVVEVCKFSSKLPNINSDKLLGIVYPIKLFFLLVSRSI